MGFGAGHDDDATVSLSWLIVLNSMTDPAQLLDGVPLHFHDIMTLIGEPAIQPIVVYSDKIRRGTFAGNYFDGPHSRKILSERSSSVVVLVSWALGVDFVASLAAVRSLGVVVS